MPRLLHISAVAVLLAAGLCPNSAPLLGQNEFQGLIAESADENFRHGLVRVLLTDVRRGVMYRDRYIPEVEVRHEASMWGAVLDSQGNVLVVLDGFTVHDKKLQGIEAWLETSDGRKLKASVAGADLRLDLLLLRSPQLGQTHLPLGKSLQSERLHFVAPSPQGWAVRTPHFIRIQPVQRLPEWELEVNASNEAVPGGGLRGTYILDGRGDIAGIITRHKRYFRRDGQDEGIAVYYALPSETLRDSLQRIKKEKLVSAGWVGVDLAEIPKKGIVITNVWPGTPAQRAGLQVEDIIRQVDGWKPDNIFELGGYIRWKSPGQTITLSVERMKARRTLRVQLGERYQPSVWAIRVPDEWDGQEVSPEKLRLERQPLILPLDLGLELEALNKHWAAKLKFPGKLGVMVSNLVEGAPAEEYFQVGDIITQVNGQPVCCLKELRKVLAASPDPKVEVKLFRDGEYMHVALNLRR
ncbi:MAG TPA: PDZ domain-containing protein [Acidobacteriota bacterium]|nr:PDZ domain-containing protein [Acidobacteriota bacterium]